MAQINVTQDYVEVLSGDNYDLRVSQNYVEALAGDNYDLRISQNYIEVLHYSGFVSAAADITGAGTLGATGSYVQAGSAGLAGAATLAPASSVDYVAAAAHSALATVAGVPAGFVAQDTFTDSVALTQHESDSNHLWDVTGYDFLAIDGGKLGAFTPDGLFTDLDDYAAGDIQAQGWEPCARFAFNTRNVGTVDGEQAVSLFNSTINSYPKAIEPTNGPQAADIEAVIEFRVDYVHEYTSYEAPNGIVFRNNMVFGESTGNAYCIGLRAQTSPDDQFCLWKLTNGGITQAILSTQTYHMVSGQRYRVRVRAEGTSLKGKVWAVGEAEPANWMIDHTDSSLNTSSQCGMISARRGATMDVFQFGYTTDLTDSINFHENKQ